MEIVIEILCNGAIDVYSKEPIIAHLVDWQSVRSYEQIEKYISDHDDLLAVDENNDIRVDHKQFPIITSVRRASG